MSERIAELMRGVKHEFMTYRNGVTADVLRRAGMDCYHVIFGLNLPQLKEIATRLEQKYTHPELRELADALWADKGVRCSRLLACDLYGRLGLSEQDAAPLTASTQTKEEAQVLTLRLRR